MTDSRRSILLDFRDMKKYKTIITPLQGFWVVGDTVLRGRWLRLRYNSLSGNCILLYEYLISLTQSDILKKIPKSYHEMIKSRILF
jgi:hypothetical protein